MTIARVGDVPLLSKEQTIEVIAKERVVWPDKSRIKEQSEIFHSPKRKFLDSLPRSSLLREIGELQMEGQAFLDAPKKQRKSWLEARGKATPLVADRVSLTVVSQLVARKDYALALEELNRMKAQPQQAVGYKSQCEHGLALQK